MLSDKELNLIVGPILQKWLSNSGLESFSVESGEDHDGDPALFIEARFRSQDFDATSLLDGIGEIREELRKRGDPRLPYMRYKIPDLPHEVVG